MLFPYTSFALDLGNIISDHDFTNSTSMSRTALNSFLDKKGILHSIADTDPWGNVLSITDIIINAAKYYRINPQVLVVTAQKEQSAITDTSLSQYQKNWMMGYGVCDSCSTDDPALQKFIGPWKQFNNAAKQFRNYLDNASSWGISPGSIRNIDDDDVRVKNVASGALLRYTPHRHGNEVFDRLWRDWFALNLINGTIVKKQSTNSYFLIKSGEKREFKSLAAVVANYDLKSVLTVSAGDLDRYSDGAPIRFPNGTLAMAPSGGVYLIWNDEKRGIGSQEVFKRLGYSRDEVFSASWDELKDIPTGPTLTEKDLYPTSTLLQSRTNGAVFLIEEGVLHPVVSREVLKNRFAGRHLSSVTQKELDSFDVGAPVQLKDGTLVKTPGVSGVFIISDGERRKILTGEAFTRYGFSWGSVIEVDARTFNLHPEGAKIK
ncbi:MAG: hypothetical protein HYV34_03425 [Candidatus Kerfeldbacteria bacterium]|nr:hypothetical protein [Candidatus Kerfeldbacteria bacterium]